MTDIEASTSMLPQAPTAGVFPWEGLPLSTIQARTRVLVAQRHQETSGHQLDTRQQSEFCDMIFTKNVFYKDETLQKLVVDDFGAVVFDRGDGVINSVINFSKETTIYGMLTNGTAGTLDPGMANRLRVDMIQLMKVERYFGQTNVDVCGVKCVIQWLVQHYVFLRGLVFGRPGEENFIRSMSLQFGIDEEHVANRIPAQENFALFYAYYVIQRFQILSCVLDKRSFPLSMTPGSERLKSDVYTCRDIGFNILSEVAADERPASLTQKQEAFNGKTISTLRTKRGVTPFSAENIFNLVHQSNDKGCFKYQMSRAGERVERGTQERVVFILSPLHTLGTVGRLSKMPFTFMLLDRWYDLLRFQKLHPAMRTDSKDQLGRPILAQRDIRRMIRCGRDVYPHSIVRKGAMPIPLSTMFPNTVLVKTLMQSRVAHTAPMRSGWTRTVMWPYTESMTSCSLRSIGAAVVSGWGNGPRLEEDDEDEEHTEITSVHVWTRLVDIRPYPESLTFHTFAGGKWTSEIDTQANLGKGGLDDVSGTLFSIGSNSTTLESIRDRDEAIPRPTKRRRVEPEDEDEDECLFPST